MLDLHGISQASFNLIVAAEVTSQRYYEAHYQKRLEHPNDNSGPTGGCGYDFGTQTAAQIRADWSGKIGDAMLKVLIGAAGLRGDKAEAYCNRTRGLIDIPWDVAMDVFSNHDLPRYLGICRRLLPGFDALSPDCAGVILSIAFNRDAGGFNKPGLRYAEMRQIKAAIASGELAKVPGYIRSMKRLWPNEAGLRDRRDDEARLFERGLAETHPHEAAKAATTPDPISPDVVAHVQARLRELGYYEVGQVDGEAVSGGKAEGAILLYRNARGLPLTPEIDQQLVDELGKPQAPRQVSETRANASVEDLRDSGSETIALTDRIKGFAGKLTGGGTGLGLSGLLAWFTDRATQVSAAKDAAGGLGLTPEIGWIILAAVLALAVIAGVGILVWHGAHLLEQKRLADYRTGKNP